MKICSICKIEKEIKDFPVGHTFCRKCKYIKYKNKRLQNKDKRRNQRNKWRQNNRFKHLAHLKLQYAIKCGKIKKELCKKCGEKFVHGHHPDYSRPLLVVWLCPQHHRAIHS